MNFQKPGGGSRRKPRTQYYAQKNEIRFNALYTLRSIFDGKRIYEQDPRVPGYTHRDKDGDEKIKVLLASLQKDGSWVFHTMKNKTATHFLLIALDEFESIVCEWLVPATIGNDKVNLILRNDSYKEYLVPECHIYPDFEKYTRIRY